MTPLGRGQLSYESELVGNQSTLGCVELLMTNLQPALRFRDPMTALFAAALDGDIRAEHELRELARHHDRAAAALCALAYTEVTDDASPTCPADVAAADQLIAAIAEALVKQDGPS